MGPGNDVAPHKGRLLKYCVRTRRASANADTATRCQAITASPAAYSVTPARQ